MRLQKSDYIRLWYIAALSQLTTKNSIPQEDITIFNGLLEVHRRLVKKLEKYDDEVDDIENHYNSNSPKFKDPEVKSIQARTKFIREKKVITESEIKELSFELFETIPEMASFFVRFIDITDLYFFIDELKKHPKIPLGETLLKNLNLIFGFGYIKKAKHNFDYPSFNQAISDALLALKKCFEVKEKKFPFESDDSQEWVRMEKYIENMCEVYCNCNRIEALGNSSNKKQDETNQKISETKRNSQKAKEHQAFCEKFFADIAKKENEEGLTQEAACEKFFNENKELCNRNGTNTIKSLQNFFSKRNKERDVYNRGDKIQQTLYTSQWRNFKQKYEEWVMTSHNTSYVNEYALLEIDKKKRINYSHQERVTFALEYIDSLKGKKSKQLQIIRAILANGWSPPITPINITITLNK